MTRRAVRVGLTGDFTAPDVPTQPEFEGMRGRIVPTLQEGDCTPDGEYGREWLRDRLDDLADDGRVEVVERDGGAVAGLRT